MELLTTQLQIKTPEKVLDFDTECRPMHYSEWRPESQITGIAWSWMDGPRIDTLLLEQDLSNEEEMIAEFVRVYDEADMVVGHYLRKHDLPLLNDHCLRLGLPLLQPKLVTDSMSDMTAIKALGKSQDNLSITFGLSAEKHHMTGADWRIANSLDPVGQAGTWERVRSDVKQNKQLYLYLKERGALKAPKLWRP